MTRLICALSLVYLVGMTFAAGAGHEDQFQEGRNIFRYDTFGDEQLWTDVLRMHEVLPAVDAATALSVGLKVDVEALGAASARCRRRGQGRRRRSGTADERRDHVRAVSFLSR
jgi:hypothetical protein